MITKRLRAVAARVFAVVMLLAVLAAAFLFRTSPHSAALHSDVMLRPASTQADMALDQRDLALAKRHAAQHVIRVPRHVRRPSPVMPSPSPSPSPAQTYVPPPVPAPDPGTAQRIAYDMLPGYGFNQTTQFTCLVQLWNRESGWRWNAQEPTSGAYGIPQSLPASKMAMFGSDYLTNPRTQIRWGLWYIQQTYITPCGAWYHDYSDGWY